MARDRKRPPGVLYLSRDGILDGLGESQILGYLRELAAEYRFWLVTFEKSRDRRAPLGRTLAARGIRWIPLGFHGRSARARAGWDLAKCLLLSAWLIMTRRIRIIHARGYVPCALALVARTLCLSYPRVIFDMRGFWIDERAEAGQWRPGGLAYRLGKRLERRLLRGAAEIVTLTEAARVEAERLRGPTRNPAPTTVIATCVDTERFRPVRGAARAPLPADWRDRVVFVYTGAAGFWQDPDGLVRFFAAVRQERADAAFLCLLRTGADEVRSRLAASGLGTASVVHDAVPPEDLPRWLSASSVGVVWYRPTYSRIGNFPTKLGEYLACGLPVIVAGATADSAELVQHERVGVVVRNFSAEGYAEAIAEALALVKNAEIAARCRRVAEHYLSVRVGRERYAEIYRRLAWGAS